MTREQAVQTANDINAAIAARQATEEKHAPQWPARQMKFVAIPIQRGKGWRVVLRTQGGD